MKKEFRRNICDDVWVMHNNKPELCYVFAINYCEFIFGVSFELEKSEKYVLKSRTDNVYVDQFDSVDVFDTKEDLIKSL